MDPVIVAAVAIVALVIAIPVIIKVGRHHTCREWGEVKGGWQYCKVCGQGRQPEKQPCLHPKWKVKFENPITTTRTGPIADILEAKGKGRKEVVTGRVYILECESCGELKNHKIEV